MNKITIETENQQEIQEYLKAIFNEIRSLKEQLKECKKEISRVRNRR